MPKMDILETKGFLVIIGATVVGRWELTHIGIIIDGAGAGGGVSIEKVSGRKLQEYLDAPPQPTGMIYCHGLWKWGLEVDIALFENRKRNRHNGKTRGKDPTILTSRPHGIIIVIVNLDNATAIMHVVSIRRSNVVVEKVVPGVVRKGWQTRSMSIFEPDLVRVHNAVNLLMILNKGRT